MVYKKCQSEKYEDFLKRESLIKASIYRDVREATFDSIYINEGRDKS